MPELIEHERRRCPRIDAICSALGPHAEVRPVAVPIDCLDGSVEAFYARPERFLDERVRGSQSGWAFLDPDVESRFVASLEEDLSSGALDDRYRAWRTRPAFEGALRLIVGRRSAPLS